MTTGNVVNYQTILNDIKEIATRAGRDPTEITLVAISKTQPFEKIQQAYVDGCRHFGENRVLEALEKLVMAPDDIFWHFVGSLQTKKVAKVIGKFHLIHSVDSLKLAEAIDRHSKALNCKTKILLQVNTSGEASKHGLSVEEWKSSFEDVLALKNTVIQGLMTMAPFVNDEKVIRTTFAGLRRCQEDLQALAGDVVDIRHLSMGMSHDYKIAIEEGATIVRIGTAIFER